MVLSCWLVFAGVVRRSKVGLGVGQGVSLPFPFGGG